MVGIAIDGAPFYKTFFTRPLAVMPTDRPPKVSAPSRPCGTGEGGGARLARKGRGAASRDDGRFEPYRHEAIDDGWGALDEPLPPLKTTVSADTARSVITHNESPDVGFDQSLNPYRGCEHGCIYCYARPSHAYLGLSPGLDFETRLYAKHDAPALLRAELSRPQYRPRVLALGVNTDAYQPIERRLQLTRRVLEVLAEFEHPVSLITKSSLIERDLDLLAPMATKGLAQAFVTVTTLKHELARKLEPRATAPTRRIETIKRLVDAGVPVGVMVAPVIPVLTDGEIEAILAAAHTAGAREAGYVLLRLPHEIKDLFKEWLDLHAPLAKEHVLARLREARGGRDNDSRFGSRMVGEGEYAELIRKRFALQCKRLGLNRERRDLTTERFRVPPAAGDQLDLFAR